MKPADSDDHSQYWICLAVFCVQRFFDSGGPAFTTFAVPSQIFPTRIRGLAHGTSAAAGKLGAVVGTFLFPFLHSNAGLRVVFYFMAGVCAITVVWTRLFVPSYGPFEL